METVKLNPGSSEDKPYFWRRQFQLEPTEGQRKTDWVFGVILPAACFFLDPIVFHSNIGYSMLSAYRPFAYILSYVSIMAMAAWLLWGKRLKGANTFLAGLFAVGGVISLLVGIAILPYSIPGMFLIIGLLGFTPFFTAVVYLRNARRALADARPYLETKTLVAGFLLTGLMSVVIPSTINRQIFRETQRLVTGDAAEVRAATAKLRYVQPLVDVSMPLANRYFRANTDAPTKEALAEAHLTLEGTAIETKEWVAN